jgi:hypothetical protein
MLRIIFTRNPIIRDTCVASLSLARNPTEASVDFIVYQKADWILIFSREHDIDVILPTILDLWDPDRIYLPYLGRSVDMMHEIGDVILPNVFLSYHLTPQSPLLQEMGGQTAENQTQKSTEISDPLSFRRGLG